MKTAGARRGGRPRAPTGERQRHGRGAAPHPLREALPAARRPLEEDQREGEEQQHAGELGRRDALEHPVPDAIDRFGVGPVPEGRHGPEVGEGLHHRQRRAGDERRPGERERHAEECDEARAAEAPRGFQRRPALRAERRAGEEIDVRVVDEDHHQGDAAVRADLGQAQALAEGAAERGLHRAREVEETEEGEADDVGGHGERQDERPLEHRAAGEAMMDDEPGERGAEHQGAGPHAREKPHRIPGELDELGAPEVNPDLDGGAREGGENGERRGRRRGRRCRPPRRPTETPTPAAR